MKNNATNESRDRFWVWIIWAFVLISAMSPPATTQNVTMAPLLGVCVEAEESKRLLFPWRRWNRCKKWAYQKYKEGQARYRKAKRMVKAAQAAKIGLLSMASVVDCLIQSQYRYKLGALPVLYALLEILEVRESIGCDQNEL